MKQKLCMFLAVLFATLSIVPAGAASTQNTAPVTHLYTFGDSSIDIGRAKALTSEIITKKDAPAGAYIKAEEDWYWEGRYSNGRVFSELLAEHLQVDITSYAVGGAKSGPDATGNTNWSSWLPGTGGTEQTKEFVKDMNGAVDPDALYLISTGGNDQYNLATDTVEHVTAQSASYIQEMVADLAQAGAKRFVVMLQSKKPGKALTPYAAQHQEATRAAMAQAERNYGVSILCIDASPLVESIEKDPQAYGYKTLSYYIISDFVPTYGYAYHRIDNTKQFQDAPKDIWGVYTYDGFTGADKNGFYTPDEYYFYDEYHVTRTTHQHIASYIIPLVDAFVGAHVSQMTDVQQGDWYYDAVASVLNRKLFLGTSKTLFSPNETMERGMFCVVLARLLDVDLSSYTKSELSDVSLDSYYGRAANWAVEEGILPEREDGFAPEMPITREDMAYGLVQAFDVGHYARVQAISPSVPFADDASISTQYREAVYQAKDMGFIVGDDAGNFNPRAYMMRAQAAIAVTRFISNTYPPPAEASAALVSIGA